MPAYITQPAVQTYPPTTIPAASPGIQNYSFGTPNNYVNGVPSEATVTAYAVTSNVVTLTLSYGYTQKFAAGRTLVVSGVASPDNFINGTYTIVSAPTATTVTAALTHADVASAPVSGLATQSAIGIGAEVAETMPANGTAGRQFAVRSFSGTSDNSVAITWQGTYGGTVSAAIVTLQGALSDEEAQYFTIDTDNSHVNFMRTVNLGTTKVNFLRIKVTSSTNTSGTFIGKFVV